MNRNQLHYKKPPLDDIFDIFWKENFEMLFELINTEKCNYKLKLDIT